MSEQTKTDLQERIKELEAKVAAGEEAALKRVCDALNVSPDDVESSELSRATEHAPEPIIKCFVATPVRVNMTVYQGWVEVSKSTFEVIQQAIGDRRMRFLRELTGSKYMLQELAGGGSTIVVTERVNEAGERIA